MTTFSTTETKPVNTVFRLPVDTSTGPKGLLRSEYIQEQNSMLYPLVSNMPQEEVDQFLAAGMVGPVQKQAEGVTQQKKLDVYNEIIEVTALDQKTPEQAISELETLRDENPFLKAYVSPAVLEALKQSDNPTARRAAQGKLANVLIASELLNNKLSEANSGFMDGVGDFLDVMSSDLPIVSALNVERRKELSDRFLQLMDSNDEPAAIRTEMESIINEAADMGFFTDTNRFYLNDFLGLTLEQGQGEELAFQQLMSAVDVLAVFGALGDTGKLIAATRGSVDDTTKALLKGVDADNIAGAVDPAAWKESIITSERLTPRTPIEASAVKNVEAELKATEEAIKIRLAAGEAIDDDLFEIVKQDIKAKALDRAKKSGNLRYIDARTEVSKDFLENVSLTEYYGTTKGKAFSSQTAAKIYADQILGEVVPVPGQTNQWMVAKKSNIPTGYYSQGAEAKDIVADLALWKPLQESELGEGVFARWGSPLSQTDSTNNAVNKQGEAARSMATMVVERDVARQLKIVGKDGKEAVERVYTELRDGQFASMRAAPTVAQFDDMFFKVNARRATPAELKLHELKLAWNETDWVFSADLHFKKAVERGIEILVPQDGIEVGAVLSTREANAGRQVWDIDSKSYQPIDTLNPDRKVYKLVEPMEFDGKLHDLVASATPKTRALRHTDVMGYNAGGSRLYESNYNNIFIKQDTEYDLADGVKRQGMPRTIMAVKTQKEAVKAVGEINEVINTLHKIVDPKAFTKAADYLAVIQTKYKDANLNELIARNSGWNTDVHGVKELVEWATENGFDLRKTVAYVGDGQPLKFDDDIIGDITFKDVAISPGPLKMGDFRRDTVLMGYGGRKLPTIAPFESISRSVMSSVARQTEVAYETRAIMRLYRTAVEGILQPGGKRTLLVSNIDEIRNMSLRQKARNMKIDTTTSFGRKLELERKKILHRLEGQRVIDEAYHKKREAFANILYDKGHKKAAENIDALSIDPNTAARGIIFDRFMGMWAIDQIWVQGSQMLAIQGLADKAIGAQASAIAPFFRGTLLNGHKAVDEKMAKLMGGAIGVDPKQMQVMLDTFKSSGKGFIGASVSDLGEGSGGKVMFKKIREAGRIPFNEGELLSRITAHVSASMEYLKKFGNDADLTKQHASRWVMHESDRLTMAMTSQSRNTFEQFPGFQFLTYPMRVTEYMLGGIAGGKSVLSTKQKIKFGLTQIAYFGAVAVPGAGYVIDKYNREYGTDLSEDDFYQIRHGLIDNAIRYLTGVETEIGTRLAWGEGLFNTLADVQDKSLMEVLTGPAGATVVDAVDIANRFVFNIQTGGISALGSEDIWDVVRFLKSGNMAYNAWKAWNFEQIFSRSGSVLDTTASKGEAIAFALGVPLNKVNAYWREVEAQRKDEDFRRQVGKEISSLYQEWFAEREANGSGTKREKIIIGQIEALNKLHMDDMSNIQRYVNKDFISKIEQQTLEIQARETKRKAAE